MGGSPGLVVMGWDLEFKDHGFKSQHQIPNGHFSHWFVIKNYVDVFLKKTENERKRGQGMANFKDSKYIF